MFGRKKSRGPRVSFGDPNHGFVVPISSEGLKNSGFDRHLHAGGSEEAVIGDGSPSGFHIVMSALGDSTVMILLGGKPRDIGGTVLGYATPTSPYWQKVLQVMAGASQTVVGIPALVRAEAGGGASVYVVTD